MLIPSHWAPGFVRPAVKTGVSNYEGNLYELHVRHLRVCSGGPQQNKTLHGTHLQANLANRRKAANRVEAGSLLRGLALLLVLHRKSKRLVNVYCDRWLVNHERLHTEFPYWPSSRSPTKHDTTHEFDGP